MTNNHKTTRLLLLALLLVGQIHARIIIDPGVDAAGNDLYAGTAQGRQVTALFTITTTVSSILTTTSSMLKSCVKLSTSGNLTPSTTCSRRRREEEEPLLYVIYGSDGEDMEFVEPDRIRPYKVSSVEATEVAVFRDNMEDNSPAIKSSLDESSHNSNPDRNAEPVYFAALAALLASVFSSAVESTTTQTITSTFYAGGTSIVSIISTTSFTLVGSCYPTFPPAC